MAVDLGLDDLVNRVKDLPANSLGFASNMIALVEAAFLSDRNPFGPEALGDPIDPGDALLLDAVNTWNISENVVASLVLPEAMGGSGNYTYTLTDSDDTPLNVPGLNFVAATRILSGTPTTAGTYPVKYMVSDGTTTLSRIFNIVVAGTTDPLTLPRPPGRTLTVGTAFSETFGAASGGTGNYTYEVTGSVPPGLNFNAGSRTLSGTPSQSGTYLMNYRVNDGANVVSRQFTYTVESGGPISGSRSATDSSVRKEGFTVFFESNFGAFDFPDSWFATNAPGDGVSITIEIVRNILFGLHELRIEFGITTADFHADVEQDLFITFSSSSATDFTVRGPTHSTNQSTDTSEPYSWLPDSDGVAAAIDFWDAISAGDSVTITFRMN